MSNITAPQVHCKAVSGIRNMLMDFTPDLAEGELLTGTPTVVEVSTSDLTLANVAINTVSTEVLFKLAKISTAVQWNVTGGTADTTYIIRVTASTDATPAQTIIRRATLKVVTD